MKNTKNQLNFSKSDRNGAVLLSIIILIIALLPTIWPFFKTNGSDFDITKFEGQINDFIENQKVIEAEKKQKFTYYNTSKKENSKSFNFKNIAKSTVENKISPTYFNPNNLPVDKWLAMGFTDKQISVIKNYEKKGGRFYKKEDLKKMYCIDDPTYSILEPYIIIPKDSSGKKIEKKYEKFDYSNIIIDINTADTVELKKLKGIGSSYSKRIVKYRNALGGFAHIDQLLEVWGFSNDLLSSIKTNIVLENTTIRKININTTSIDELKKHPYIDFYVARSIVKYRESHGNYTQIEEIKKSDLVHDDLFNKLKPYLTTK